MRPYNKNIWTNRINTPQNDEEMHLLIRAKIFWIFSQEFLNCLNYVQISCFKMVYNFTYIVIPTLTANNWLLEFK